MIQILKRWLSYSPWKQLGILTLIAAGFAIGFITGYIKGAEDISQLVLNMADRVIDQANITITFKEAVHSYLLKGGFLQ